MRSLSSQMPVSQTAYDLLRKTFHALSNLNVRRRERTLVSRYLDKNGTRKLHIGCGGNVLDGWLNSDYFPKNPMVIHLDATRQFPFASDTFDYIFSEHMIEHIKYFEGVHMLKECSRTLKPGGRIRISTPDLQFLISLYSEEKSDLQRDYINWACDTFVRNDVKNDTMVINNFVRDWGHLFIYDEKTLRKALETAGFVDIMAFKINESNDVALRGLENESRMPAGFLKLESFTLEARKN